MDKVPLGGEAPNGTIGGRTGTGAAIDPGCAVGPILKKVGDQWQLIGTGFFISTGGIFATAKHVLMDVIDFNGHQTHPIAIVQFTTEETYALRPILRGSIHNTADAAVGVAAPMRNNKTNEPLKSKACVLSSRQPSIGEQACTYAYPNTVNKHGTSPELHLFPDFYDGRIEEYYPTGRDRVFLPAPCYRTSISIHGGASGGPVFDGFGLTCGINSTGFSGAPVISFITRIIDILSLTVTDVDVAGRTEKEISILELAKLGHILFKPELGINTQQSAAPLPCAPRQGNSEGVG